MSVSPFMFAPSASTEPVIVEMNGSIFRIPRNFLMAAAMGGGDSHILILTITPDFSGWSAFAKSQYDAKNKDFIKREVRIYAEGGNASASGRNKNILEIPSDKMDEPDNSGLKFVRENPFASADDVFVHYSKNKNQNDDAVIVCDKLAPLACTVYLDTPQRIELQYQFHRSQLENWESIRRGVLNLWNSFYAGDAK